MSDRKSLHFTCEDGECIAGMIGATMISERDWDQAVKDFDVVINDWNEKTRRFAIPHPGFAVRANHCMTCGKALQRAESGHGEGNKDE